VTFKSFFKDVFQEVSSKLRNIWAEFDSSRGMKGFPVSSQMLESPLTGEMPYTFSDAEAGPTNRPYEKNSASNVRTRRITRCESFKIRNRGSTRSAKMANATTQNKNTPFLSKSASSSAVDIFHSTNIPADASSTIWPFVTPNSECNVKNPNLCYSIKTAKKFLLHIFNIHLGNSQNEEKGSALFMPDDFDEYEGDQLYCKEGTPTPSDGIFFSARSYDGSCDGNNYSMMECNEFGTASPNLDLNLTSPVSRFRFFSEDSYHSALTSPIKHGKSCVLIS